MYNSLKKEKITQFPVFGEMNIPNVHLLKLGGSIEIFTVFYVKRYVGVLEISKTNVVCILKGKQGKNSLIKRCVKTFR